MIDGTILAAPDLVLGSKFEKEVAAGDLDGELDLVVRGGHLDDLEDGDLSHRFDDDFHGDAALFGSQIFNQYKYLWCPLLAKFVSNPNGVIWWLNGGVGGTVQKSIVYLGLEHLGLSFFTSLNYQQFKN